MGKQAVLDGDGRTFDEIARGTQEGGRMNRALPPGDRGHRSGTTLGESRRSGLVPRACRLGGRTPPSPEREKPPRRNPGRQCTQNVWLLSLDRVPPLAVLALDGHDGKPHFLAQRSADRIRVHCGAASCCLHDHRQRAAILPFQEVEDLARFCCRRGDRWLFWPWAFGRFLGRAGLLPRLALFRRNVRATWRTAGLFSCFRLLVCKRGSGSAAFLPCSIVMLIFSFGGDYRGQDMDHSSAPESKGFCQKPQRAMEWRWSSTFGPVYPVFNVVLDQG